VGRDSQYPLLRLQVWKHWENQEGLLTRKKEHDRIIGKVRGKAGKNTPPKLAPEHKKKKKNSPKTPPPNGNATPRVNNRGRTFIGGLLYL